MAALREYPYRPRLLSALPAFLLFLAAGLYLAERWHQTHHRPFESEFSVPGPLDWIFGALAVVSGLVAGFKAGLVLLALVGRRRPVLRLTDMGIEVPCGPLWTERRMILYAEIRQLRVGKGSLVIISGEGRRTVISRSALGPSAYAEVAALLARRAPAGF
jgi:hypothetical protein